MIPSMRPFFFALAIAAVLAAVGPQTAWSQSPAPESGAFDAWLQGVRDEARSKGISQETIDAALSDVSPIDRVIELDRRQPEFTLTFQEYMARVVPDSRVQTGREKYARHQNLLREVGQKFGVQPRFVVALWGIETNFGRTTGGFPVVASLATLAFDGRRSEYFRRELFNALKIIDEGHIGAAEMQGSWAGAMGQSQFMPSSFLSYAVDYNGDGRRDIWTTTADVFASAANYLSQAGWKDDQTWGRPVRLPDGFSADDLAALMPAKAPSGCRALRRLSVEKPLSEWQAMGIRRENGQDLPGRDLPASLVLPEGVGGPAMLVYNNFRATLRWNCSIYFATAVGTLAERIGAR